jgi:hypothetical protein
VLPLSGAHVATTCAALLADVDGAVRVDGPGRAPLARRLAALVRLAPGAAPAAAAVVSFLGARADATARAALLDAVRDALPAGAPLVVVDHNQPRTWARRLLGAALLAAHGLPPARARHPTARELLGRGFVVERLRLASGERVQVVRARRAA